MVSSISEKRIAMNPIIKWPGGKSGEIVEIEELIPSYQRYVEPFVGGGAVYFYLPNSKAIINDISVNLVNLYELIKQSDSDFKSILLNMNDAWCLMQTQVASKMDVLVDLYYKFSEGSLDVATLDSCLLTEEKDILKPFNEHKAICNYDDFCKEVHRMVFDKIKRTVKNEIKLQIKLSLEDLKDNILTGFTSGFYMYMRNEHNRAEKDEKSSVPYRTALFYFVREFCYGSMFRYNSKGEFNIPYGGIAYNNKDFKKKIDHLFSKEIVGKFAETEIMCGDFEEVFKKLNENDFMFVDPPYDTEFSDYEGRSFGKNDQERLRDALAATKAKFILIIKNTEFIFGLYNNEHFKIKSFDKNYSYCVKNRNNRAVDHLIITNY